MTANDRLGEIQARSEQAIDGPWEKYRKESTYGHISSVVAPNVDEGSLRGVPFLLTVATNLNDADAEFIAHARTDVPRLVAALRAVLAVDTDGIRQKYGLAVEGGAVLALSKVHAAVEGALGEVDQ